MSSPIPPRQRLEEVYQQYAGIGGRRPTGFGPNRVRSLPDGIAQALQEYLENTGWQFQEITPEELETIEEISQPETWLEVGDLCPECGQAALGWAKEQPIIKPRLPLPAVLHWDTYQEDDLDYLLEYDHAMIETGIYKGRQVDREDRDPAEYGWMEHSTRRTNKPSRPHLRQAIISSGFQLK